MPFVFAGQNAPDGAVAAPPERAPLFDGLGTLDDEAEPAGAALFDGLGDLDEIPAPAPAAAEQPAAGDLIADEADVPEEAAEEDLGGDPEAVAAPAARRRRSTRGTGGEPARKAVFDALALLGQLGAPVPGASGPAAPMMPTARVRPALDTLAGAGSIEALNEARVNLKALVRDACNWDATAGNRGTGAVVKALGRVITATDADGRSTYPQAVEMVSFASVCAPLLESDRLVRLIEDAVKYAPAYAPIRYTAVMFSQLQMLLGHFAPQRREQLLLSLWEAAHKGRWWEVLDTDAPGDGQRPRRRRRRADEDEQRALREAHEEQLRQLFGERDAVPTARLVIDALQSGALVYSPMAVARLRNTVGTADELAELGRVARQSLDADVAVLVAHVPGIPPDLRPESPLPRMVNDLVAALNELDDPDDDDEEAEHDRNATGIARRMPAKAREWAELYPRASGNKFPYPKAIRALNGLTVPGTGGPGQPPEALIEMIRTPHGLQLNGNEMGNCTYTYRDACANGEMAIGRIYQSGHVYNFSIVPGNGRYVFRDRNVGTWVIREINSRANLGNVPPELTAGIRELAAQIRIQ